MSIVLSTEEDSQPLYGFEEDGMHSVIVDQQEAFKRTSIFHSIFDVDDKLRKQWKPCTTFAKYSNPAPHSVSRSLGSGKLESLLLNDEQLSSIEHAIEEGRSFVYRKPDFCPCGNVIEQRDQIKPVVSSVAVVDQTGGKHKDTLAPVKNPGSNFSPPCIQLDDESSTDSRSFFDETFFIDEVQTPPSSPLQIIPKNECTPEKQSDGEDSVDEFAASPEIWENRFLERLKEIKTSKCRKENIVPSSSNISKRISFKPSTTTLYSKSLPEDSVPVATTSQSQGASTRKFKFKKKASDSKGSQELTVLPQPPAHHGEVTCTRFPPKIVKCGASSSPILNHSMTGIIKTIPTPIPIIKTIPNPIPIIKTIPTPIPIIKTIPTPIPIIKTISTPIPIPSSIIQTGFDTKRSCDTPSPPNLEKSSSARFRGKTTKPRRRLNANPFVQTQAAGSEDDSSGEEDEMNTSGNLDDSFVDDETFGVSDSQQARYLESVRDSVPLKLGRIEKPLSPKNYGTAMDISGDSYDEEDSFCQQDDEVDYMDVGIFTQAMNNAKIELALNTSRNVRQTRRAKREAEAKKTVSQSKPRRRIVTFDDSSDSDDDFR